MKQHALTHKTTDRDHLQNSRDSENISVSSDNSKDDKEDSNDKTPDSGLKRSPPDSAEHLMPLPKKPFGKSINNSKINQD